MGLKIPCDGPEDCTDGVCCGQDYNFGSNRYGSVACSSCTGSKDYTLCHNDNDCNANETCLPDSALPQGFKYCKPN